MAHVTDQLGRGGSHERIRIAQAAQRERLRVRLVQRDQGVQRGRAHVTVRVRQQNTDLLQVLLGRIGGQLVNRDDPTGDIFRASGEGDARREEQR